MRGLIQPVAMHGTSACVLRDPDGTLAVVVGVVQTRKTRQIGRPFWSVSLVAGSRTTGL